MNDTNHKIARKFKQLMAKKSPAERLVMGCSMYDMSKSLVTSSILKQIPNATQSILRREIFLRFYGNEFSPEDQKKIIANIINF